MLNLSVKLLLIAFSIYAIPKFRSFGQIALASVVPEKEQALIYLPKKEAVKSITLGYENFVSQILWFSTLNYFGEKFLAKESMPWFNHRCDLVTDLDPDARHVFEFCGTLLSWVAKEPEHSNLILTKGISRSPNYWRYYYLRGFNYWYFLEDFVNAKKDFEYASTLPDAPSFLVSLASRLMIKNEEEDTAISFLKSAYVREQDFNAKQAIAEKLNLAVVARDIRQIESALISYKTKNSHFPNSLESLKEDNLLLLIPEDPFGDEYLYNNKSGKVSSKKGGEGLIFRGKTVKSSELGK